VWRGCAIQGTAPGCCSAHSLGLVPHEEAVYSIWHQPKGLCLAVGRATMVTGLMVHSGVMDMTNCTENAASQSPSTQGGRGTAVHVRPLAAARRTPVGWSQSVRSCTPPATSLGGGAWRRQAACGMVTWHLPHLAG
jgi:hypothetical protein